MVTKRVMESSQAPGRKSEEMEVENPWVPDRRSEEMEEENPRVPYRRSENHDVEVEAVGEIVKISPRGVGFWSSTLIPRVLGTWG